MKELSDLKFLNLSQITFFKHLNTTKFKHMVLSKSSLMGLDGAFYFSLGEIQAETKNYSFDDLNELQQDDFLEALLFELPELEF